jgi:ATP-dependent helicase HrpB
VSAAEEEGLLRAALRGYPDRIARRREPGSPRLLLANGQGAVLARESAVREAEFLVALEVQGAARSSAAEERLVRMASAVRREWIPVTRVERVHWVDESGAVRAAERSIHGAIALGERGMAPESEAAAELVSAELLRRPAGEHNEQTRRRLRFAGLEIDLPALLRGAATGRSKTFEWNLLDLLPGDIARRLERAAPATLALPSGRQSRLEYRDDGSVVAAVKLQELFGLAESPRLGAQREPVTFALLAPNGRPVQTTRDLRSFWNGAYQEVRKELRGRYPKHPWPEDPWTAPPTHRTARRR